WLISVALLHCAIVVEKREALKSWTILLAILAFGFSLIGTFIVRSGVLTSVHAFANDPERGVFILIILAVFMGGALTLFAARAGVMEAKGVFAVVSRESALVLNNILLAVAAFVVFVGTLWPLIAELFFDKKLTVGPPFFDAAFTPFMVALAIVMPIGALMPWKRANIGRALAPLSGVLVLALAAGALVWAMQTGRSAMGPFGAILAVWLVGGAVLDIWARTGRGDFSNRLGRLTRLPRADWGRVFAHGGLGIAMFGIVGLTAWDSEDIRVVDLGETFDVAGLSITLNDVSRQRGPNYFATIAEMSVAKNGRLLADLAPEKRVYPVAQMATTEAAIRNGFLSDIYLVIGDQQADGGWAVRTYVKPLANWLWGGAIIMALGGVLSLTDRRHRIGAGARKRSSVKAVAAE
ncbi:MAG: cytochrome c-type biogenesis CcmF C-terminal domain-containing protein, partial [Paracoccaceae bacterium]